MEDIIMRSGLTVRQSGSDSTQKFVELISNPFQQAFQLRAFWASLGTSIGVTVLLALTFSLLRPRNTLVYAPKLKYADSKHAPPPMDHGPFGWIKPVLRAKEDMLVEKIGMDAVFFLRFVRMLRNMFLVLGLLGLVVIIPVNVALGNQTGIPRTGVSVMTPLYVFGNGMWAQVVMAWLIDIVVCYFLWWNYKKYYQLRRTYFESPAYQNSLHARSVMIRDIPKQYRSEEGVLRLLDEINPTGHLPKSTIGRNVAVLPDLIEEHEETVRKLESVLAKYLKNPNQLPAQRPTMRAPKKSGSQASGGKVDAIEYLSEKVKGLEAHIQDIRERVHLGDATSYGFATWEVIADAHTAAFAASQKSQHGAKIALAPRPNDIIWKNLGLTKARRNNKRWLNALWITLLTILWTPLNACIAIFLSNLSNLGALWPAFQTSLAAHSGWWALVQGIAAPGLTSLVYLVLPVIFRRLQIRAGDYTKTNRERHVLRNLYNFFTFNNLIVFSLFSAVWQFVTTVIKNTGTDGDVWHALQNSKFFITVVTSLVQISPFWILWLLQRNMGAAIDIAQLWTLFYIWFAKTFMAPTPRQNIEWTAPQAFDYANYYNYFLFYTTVALCFATLQPIMLIITALYFGIDALLKKYLLIYVFVTKTESGGQAWRTLFNRIIFATLLSNLVVGLTVKSRASWGLVGALVPLLFLMLGFKWYCARTFDPGMHYYNRTASQDVERINPQAHAKAIVRAHAKFYHPALTKPLITPMVSAKAKHVLAQIYSGRTSSETGMDYSDIAMEPMPQTGKPDQSAPFEFVPEAQQDFAYYKNRSDFRQEGGDLYGRQEDLISERSGTPMSFMTGHTRTMTPYNDSPYKDGPSDYQGSPDRKISSQGHTPPQSRPQSRGILAPVARKPVTSSSGLRESISGYQQVHPDDSDLSMRHGIYTDPDDDNANLLRDAGDLRTPNGEFMSINRWQTEGSMSNSLTGTPRDDGSYDYFRHRQG